MPLAGPRPNKSQQQRKPEQYQAYPPPQYPPSSSLANTGPAFPSTPTTSKMSYPHQSSPESGTTALEPVPPHADGLSAQGVIREYHQSRYDHPGHVVGSGLGAGYAEQDVGLLAPGPFGYETPYDPPDDPYSDRTVTASPSLGPWDSASQQSLPYHHQMPSVGFPLPQLTHSPLRETRSSARGRHVEEKPSYAGLSYIDEDGEYYHSDKTRPASTLMGENGGPAGVELANIRPGSGYDDANGKYASYQDAPYPYPSSLHTTGVGGLEGGGQFGHFTTPNGLYTMLLFPTGLDRLLALFGVKTGAYPVEQAIERKKRGLGGQRWPVAAWGLTVAMTAIMIYELVANYKAMGTPIAIKPSFNYMIGPSSEVLINIGARFPPCMKDVAALPSTFTLACLNDTSSTPTTACTIEEICGHGGFNGETPDQSWRFVLPIFLHVGIIHLALNMLVQATAAAQVEREMGTVPFLIVYMAGGVYGFVLGGNFSRTGVPSAGASGALFATNACVLVDLVLHWKYEERPKLKAFLLALEFIIGFAMGYIPNAVDGLAHLGGWAMGILAGIILYPSISETKRHRYIVWGCRAVALPLIILAMVLTIKNFYTDDPNAACEWCKYLSCIPTNSNSHCTGTGITVTNTTTTKRSWDSL